MARKKYPFVLKNNLDKYLRIKQARLTVETGKIYTLKDVHEELSEYVGSSKNMVSLVKAGNYNPSLVVALAMAEFLDVTVDDLFYIEDGKED